MAYSPKLTDAELVHRLRVLRDHKTHAKAAAALQLQVRQFRESIAMARARGLTADTKVQDVESRLRTEVKLLRSELAAIERENLTAEEIRKTIFNLSEMTPEPPRWVVETKPGKTSGVPMSIWSDWHYGERVAREEIGGVNYFNRSVAKDRVRKLVERTIDLCQRHMTHPRYPGFVLCLGGDMITGDIHDDLRDTNDGSVQQSLLEVEELLIWGIEEMADHFGRLFIPCVVGNHARGTPKPRVKRHVYMSHEWNVYCHLERHFKRDKRVQFMIPAEAAAHFTVAGRRFCLTHGDMLGVKGGDGIIGAIGPIARGTFKMGRNQTSIGRDFDTLIMGHWHTYLPHSDAVPVIVNGALKGFDEYAYTGLRVPYSRPTQALWWTHPKYGITAQWPIYLENQRRSQDAAKWVTWQERIAA